MLGRLRAAGWGLMTIDDGGGLDAGEILSTARAAETAGFDCLWLGDHLLWRRPMLEPLVTIGFLAGQTQRIALGTAVALAGLRHPLWLAKEAATLERLAGPGRIRLGLGAGEYMPEFEALGIPRGERGRRLDEAAAALAAIRGGGEVSLSGRHYAFDAVRLEPPLTAAAQLWVGGRSDASVLRARRWADGWLGIFAAERRLAQVAALLEAPGRGEPPELGLYAWGRIGPGAESILADYVRASYGADPSVMRRYWLAGDETEVRKQALGLAAAGVRYLVIAVPGPDKEEQVAAWARVLELG